jgi:hypothetical protein
MVLFLALGEGLDSTYMSKFHSPAELPLNEICIYGCHRSLSIPQQKFSTDKAETQDLHEGRVMPPQQAAIIMYSNKTITHVNRALSWKHKFCAHFMYQSVACNLNHFYIAIRID